MNPDEQKQLVVEHLKRRETIAAQTRQQIDDLHKDKIDPLIAVDPEVRRAAEDEYHAAQGRHRYETSDGRTLFLTPEEIAQRRRGRSRRAQRGGRTSVPGSPEDRDRRWLVWGFNAFAVGLALLIVYVILH